MVDIAAIAGFATSVRAPVEITKAMKDVRDANLMQTKVFELTREIMSAQSYAIEAMSAQSALLTRIRELEEKIAALETWNAEKGRYYLKSIQTGVMVYALKEGMENGEEPPLSVSHMLQQRQEIYLAKRNSRSVEGANVGMP